jgi:hypothetical protein
LERWLQLPLLSEKGVSSMAEEIIRPSDGSAGHTIVQKAMQWRKTTEQRISELQWWIPVYAALGREYFAEDIKVLQQQIAVWSKEIYK